jgi:hypothetical protein
MVERGKKQQKPPKQTHVEVKHRTISTTRSKCSKEKLNKSSSVSFDSISTHNGKQPNIGVIVSSTYSTATFKCMNENDVQLDSEDGSGGEDDEADLEEEDADMNN